MVQSFNWESTFFALNGTFVKNTYFTFDQDYFLASYTTYVACVYLMHEWSHLSFKVDSENRFLRKFFIENIFQSFCITYIIGHYNPSVRIIHLVSHTSYVVCVNFIHKWRVIYSLKSSPNYRFLEKHFHANFIYSRSFCQKSA